MAEFASKGVAGTGLGLGIAGTALGLLNNNGGNGILGNILGGGNNSTTGLAETLLMVQAINGNGAIGGRSGVCSENTPATRWDIEQSEKIAHKDMEIAFYRGQNAVDEKLKDTIQYVENAVGKTNDRIDRMGEHMCSNEKEFAVFAGTVDATLKCTAGSIAGIKATLDSLSEVVVPGNKVCNRDYPVTVTNTAYNPVIVKEQD